MEEIDVTARFERTGEITPLRFTLRQVEYPVISVGRSWKDEAGRHILVMVPGVTPGETPGDRVLELIYRADQERWWLQTPGKPGANFA